MVAMRPLRLTSLHNVTTLAQHARPSSVRLHPMSYRFFSQNAQLLLVAPIVPRPHLPFLYPPSQRNPPPLRRRGQAGQWQIFRLLSTEQKLYLKDQARIGGKFFLYTGLFGISALVFLYGIHEERLERTYPSPSDWTFLTRSAYRSAKLHEEPDAFESGVVDWVLTANLYKEVVRRLEDPKIDGIGLEIPEGQVDEDARRLGLEQLGYDVTSKPYPWRRGYYEALMGAAKGAENLDRFLRDDTRGIVFPPDVVIGPSNPNPRPSPPGTASAPLEKDCSPAFKSAHAYYLQILTTKGFTVQERLLAALAYADWLDFKSLPESAMEAYTWALDIATSTLDHPESVLDLTTGVIKPDAPLISSNILLITTALAAHHARTANLSSALAIFLSVLRARRSLPAPPLSSEPQKQRSPKEQSGLTSILTSLIRPLFFPPPFPDLPPSGEEQAFRTPACICEEAGVMAHIGEVLFASSSTTAGLTWTREAVDVAEAQYESTRRDEEASERCQECLSVGIDNWRNMVASLAAAAARDENEEGVSPSTEKKANGPSWWSTIGRYLSKAEDGDRKDTQERDWQNELLMVEERAKRIATLLSHERFRKQGGAWFGSMVFT